MGIKKYNPTSPGRRFQTVSDFTDITTETPFKPLLKVMKRNGGRNNSGRITAWHRGGGNRRAYRIIDFKRDKFGVPAKIETIEYDPNRSARIALLKYKDGERRYMIAPLGLQVGDEVLSGKDAEIKIGNSLPLSHMPLGTFIHNVELRPGEGAKFVRSAGSSARLIAKEEKNVQVKLSSGEGRFIPPWGKPEGVRTRSNKRTDKFIVKRRK